MTETSTKFLKLLFNEGETVCVSPDKYGYYSINQTNLNGNVTLVSPSERVTPKIITESDINLISINPIKGFRRDENVTAFRTFLVEIDTGSLEEQKEYIESFGMPRSACVFSGNKSLHYAIVLDQDLSGIKEWQFFNDWILNILQKADQQIKNPSRSIRFPGNVRNNGKKQIQSLIELNGRVKYTDLLTWLFKYENLAPEKKKKDEEEFDGMILGEVDFNRIPPYLLKQLENGIDTDRNATWFSISCKLAERGFQLHGIIDFLEQFYQEERDFTRKEWEGCIKSAYKRIKGGLYDS